MLMLTCNSQILQQMWPYIGSVVKTILKTNVEPVVTNALPSQLTPFRFQTVDLGLAVSDSLIIIVIIL